MADLEALFRAIDDLKTEEYAQLVDYINKRRVVKWWVVPPENLAKIDELLKPVQEEASHMSEEEINAVIDQAIAEVRRERHQKQSRD